MKKKYTAKMLKLLQYSQEANNHHLLLPAIESGYTTKNVKKTLLDMKKTAFIHQLPYLSSNQVGLELSAVVVASNLNASSSYYYHPSYTKFDTYLNPQIQRVSNKQEEGYEECVSVVGIESKVNRYSDIHITYMCEDGTSKEEEISGFKSRIFQQAIDLLSGKLPIKWNISKGQNRISEKYEGCQNIQLLKNALDDYNKAILNYLQNNEVNQQYFDRSIESLNIPKEISNIRFSTKDEYIDPVERTFLDIITNLQEEHVDFMELNKLPAKRVIKQT